MGTHYNCLTEAVLTSTHNLCFVQKCEKYQSFLSEIFQFLEVKFSIYLNRRAFIMQSIAPDLALFFSTNKYWAQLFKAKDVVS